MRHVPRAVLRPFADGHLSDAGPAEHPGGVQPLRKPPRDVLGGRVAARELGVVIDVGVVELLRDRLERLLRLGEVDREVVLLELPPTARLNL